MFSSNRRQNLIQVLVLLPLSSLCRPHIRTCCQLNTVCVVVIFSAGNVSLRTPLDAAVVVLMTEFIVVVVMTK